MCISSLQFCACPCIVCLHRECIFFHTHSNMITLSVATQEPYAVNALYAYTENVFCLCTHSNMITLSVATQGPYACQCTVCLHRECVLFVYSLQHDHTSFATQGPFWQSECTSSCRYVPRHLNSSDLVSPPAHANYVPMHEQNVILSREEYIYPCIYTYMYIYIYIFRHHLQRSSHILTRCIQIQKYIHMHVLVIEIFHLCECVTDPSWM